jgi:hypothetical protein
MVPWAVPLAVAVRDTVRGAVPDEGDAAREAMRVGPWFPTVTVTFPEVPVFPAASEACAVRVWVPFDAVPVFQLQV